MPTDYVQGIDVSHFQQNVDWQKVKKAGIAFAFAKATDGTTFVDPAFEANWSRIKAGGLIRGGYHFFRADQDPVVQANHFLQITKIAIGDMPPVIDVEMTSNSDDAKLVDGVSAWLDKVEQETGIKPMIYTLASFWNAHLNNQFGSYPLWVANYGVTSPKVPAGWTNWNFWQHSQGGTIDGVTGNVDMNHFNGTLSDLVAFAKGQSPSDSQMVESDAPTTDVSDSSSTGSISGNGSGGGGYTYIVNAGDTLNSIAASFNVSPSDLQTINRMKDPGDISVGQILTIPS
jgi:lysozyme